MSVHKINAAVALMAFLAGAPGWSDDSFYLSDTAKVLGKYQEGNRVVNDLKPTGKYSEVSMKELSSEEVLKRAGHDGGGVQQDPSTGKYTILINKDLSSNDKAQAVAHELQHVRDEIEFDRFLSVNPELNKLGPLVIRGLKIAENKSEFISKNQVKVDFVMKGLFCQEERAYSVNLKLQKEGLSFSNKEISPDLGNYVYRSYIQKFGVSYTEGQIKQFEKDCLSFQSFTDFMQANSPVTSTHSPGGGSVSGTR